MEILSANHSTANAFFHLRLGLSGGNDLNQEIFCKTALIINEKYVTKVLIILEKKFKQKIKNIQKQCRYYMKPNK